MDRFIDYTKSTVQERDFNLETEEILEYLLMKVINAIEQTLKTFPEYADFFSCGALL